MRNFSSLSLQEAKRLFSKERISSYASVTQLENKANLQNYHKASLLLHLLRNLRNRVFHFENLYKINEYNKPRLIVSIRNSENSLAVNLETSKIQVFLCDLIGEFRKEVESGGKGSAKNKNDCSIKTLNKAERKSDE